MRATVERASGKIIVPVILFVAIIANAAGDAGPIVLPPLAAMVFIRLGYHPVAGLVAAYATCLGAFAANLLLGMTDVLAFAFTQPAAASVDPDVHLNVAMNYYFIAAATLILVAISYFVTMRITIPRMGSFTPEPGSDLDHDDSPITDRDRRAMRFANIAVILVVVVLLALTVPENGLLRNAETGSLTQDSPLMNGIIVVLAAFFFVPGLVYAISVGTVKNSTDLARMMIEAMSAMAGFIVIVFFAAQMLASLQLVEPWTDHGDQGRRGSGKSERRRANHRHHPAVDDAEPRDRLCLGQMGDSCANIRADADVSGVSSSLHADALPRSATRSPTQSRR